MTDSCWACGSRDITSFFAINDLALSSMVLVESRQEAASFPRGDLELVVCHRCGFMFNRRFRPELVDYTMPYESSQIFSPRFRAFAKELIDHLATSYNLTGKEILEIGGGDGSFLESLCRRAGARGIGIDPVLDPDRLSDDVDITVLRDLYDAGQTHLTADLICCRHTLEHIQPVQEFVTLVSKSAAQRPGSVVFFEVPDTQRILDEGAYWDVYNEHCSYFTLPTLSNLFRSCGFEILRLTKGFDDQYLLIDAKVSGTADTSVNREVVDKAVSDAETFGHRAEAEAGSWRGTIESHTDSGGAVVLWGASSKAVAFLAAVDRDEAVTAAVDINPYKQDKYLPGSGVHVVGPEFLDHMEPDLVIVMNPIYLEEIRAELERRGHSPEIRALGARVPA